ncbi:rod-binding protein [Desulfovibrio legallii]|uniref:Rod binding protein domain-containing protein n=1 Tax=Desulfovibrio legallii TaxID=571438 RepID=A0A1G7M7D1_9BACT|nr:rod-binding protein [Desulfovibrio legallii]SDF57633.1 Rod binding protein domain-containing protein [Desulfovibrio legallii]
MSASLGVPPLVPQAGAAELARQEVQTRLAGVNGKNLTEAQQEKKLREACQGFESIFIQKMWQEMRNTLPKSNLLQGREEQFWQGMYDQELAKKMAAAGGVGLADMMYAQLSQRLGSASQSAAAAASPARAFSPEAAPLLPPAPEAPAAQETAAGQAGSRTGAGAQGMAAIYDGAAPLRDAGAAADAAPQAVAASGIPAAAAVTNPPEVDQALAVLRAQQALQQSGEPHKQIRVTHAGRGDSGLQMARAARFQAGSKLGPGAVLPTLHPGATDAARNGRADARQGATAGAVPPLTAQYLAAPGAAAQNASDQGFAGQSAAGQAAGQTGAQQAAGGQQPMKVRYTTNIAAAGQRHKEELLRKLQPGAAAPNAAAAAQAANAAQQAQAAGNAEARPAAAPSALERQQALQPMKVRYTTNIPANGKRHKDELIRTLQTDAVGPNSRAGAGLAAYHAQQAQQAQAGQAAGLPLAPGAAGAGAGDTATGGIPPLTAADLGG